jgi:voltage-gated potassium channel
MARMTAARRNKIRRFLVIKEVFMMSLVAISSSTLVLEHFEKLTPMQLHYVDIFEIGVSIIFLTEFFFEYYYARDRALYFKHHWFYLFAAIPIPTQTFEFLHTIRVLRLLKLLKIFAHMRYERNTRLFE